MTVCEMCGRSENLVTAEIEGADLKVCSKCVKFGKVKYGHNSGGYKPRYVSAPKKEGPEEKLVENFSEILRREREKRNLNQEDFSKLLNEKESWVSKWENGSADPNLETTKKLQRVLGVTLIKKEEAEDTIKEEKQKPKGDVLTLGDFIKVKKRNN